MYPSTLIPSATIAASVYFNTSAVGAVPCPFASYVSVALFSNHCAYNVMFSGSVFAAFTWAPASYVVPLPSA